jgi:glycosyltransferase involved in cell wall biosynthesis
VNQPFEIGLFYDDDAYVEPAPDPVPASTGVPERPTGLMGRQVAGKSFLDAFLQHTTCTELAVLVRNRGAIASLERLCRTQPSTKTPTRRLRVFEEARFHDDSAAGALARLWYFPCPIESRYAWARQQLGPGTFSLSGVTHTLCSANTVRQLCELLTAPFEPHDALICTSTAVVQMARAVTNSFASYLGDRHGGDPRLNVRLEMVPLGVDTERFRPPASTERAAAREALEVNDDEVAVLFVGRLAHHAKAHPFPMFRGVDLAARATGRSVHLLMAGWAPNRPMREAFVEGARVFAPGVRVSFVDGIDPARRSWVWQAADVFVSLVDNIQETFGLVIVEAMASGLPVVATDWNGYRDLVVDGGTGLLVPTLMVCGATGTATSRLMFGTLDYDHFLAECSQTVTVDVAAAGAALARLVADPELRRSLGAAGRERALRLFAWPRVIAAYEALWRDQEAERLRFNAATGTGRPSFSQYPPLDRSFAGYPTRWIDPEGRDIVMAVAGSLNDLDRLLNCPLTNHAAECRIADADLLRCTLAAAERPSSVAALDELFRCAGVDHHRARATIAWMLKYDLLRSVVCPS